MVKIVTPPPNLLRFGKVHAVNDQAFGWWVSDDGRVIEVVGDDHDAVFSGMIKRRGIDPHVVQEDANMRDFALHYVGWLLLRNAGDILEIECASGRIAKRAFDAFASFLKGSSFVGYSLTVRDINPDIDNTTTTYTNDRDLLRVLRSNLVQQIMPQAIAARKRVIAYLRAHPEKQPRPLVGLP